MSNLNVESKAELLIDSIRRYKRVTVAFSGGVDSSVVAAAATKADLDGLVAVTADSASVPRWQMEWATRIAAQIGIKHRVVLTEEVRRAEYARNDSKRCFYCKETLYSALAAITDSEADGVIVSGTNADDLGDYRPGIEAGRLANVSTPLADLGYGKSDVRELARWFGLENAELPASPCLASRVAYGVEVTVELLRRVERAEQWLRQQGFRDLRVRVHHDELARVEVLRDEMPRLFEQAFAIKLQAKFREIGFQYVTVDLQGLQSGSMNRVLVNLT